MAGVDGADGKSLGRPIRREFSHLVVRRRIEQIVAALVGDVRIGGGRIGAVASSARAEYDNAVKPITSPANFAARPQDTRPKDVRFLRNTIGVTWAGPGQIQVRFRSGWLGPPSRPALPRGQACKADRLRERAGRWQMRLSLFPPLPSILSSNSKTKQCGRQKSHCARALLTRPAWISLPNKAALA